MQLLTHEFYNRDPLIVAKDLLGKILIRRIDNVILSGRIVETEAYIAFSDEAAHSFQGKTQRNKSQYLGPGHTYIHQIHQQNCLDIVTEDTDIPSSVLIRALEPLEGISTMKKLRGREDIYDLASGPGKLCQSLFITRELDGIDVCDPDSAISLYDDNYIVENIVETPRIGISKATQFKYRFYIKNNPFVSRK